MSYSNLVEKLGFPNDPFAKVNADEEERLVEYFIEPPFFKAVNGSSDDPKSYIVFAPRGGGKTALKRKIEITSAESEDYLCVTYNTFDVSGKKLEDINLDYHIQNIIKLILIGLIPHVPKNEYDKISKDDKHILYFLIKDYFTDIDFYELKESIEAVKSQNQKAKEWWNKLVNPLEMIVNTLLPSLGLSPIEISQLTDKDFNLGTPVNQLKTLQRIAQNLGFSSIYILIDKVDENQLTGNALQSYLFIEPLLKNLSVFELKGFAFKVFLWDRINSVIHQQQEEERIRLDRIQNRKLQWNKSQLIEMLSRRLLAFSEHKVSSLNDIFQNIDGINWDDTIVSFGLGSPRTIIRLCKEIFEQQSEIDSETHEISIGAINRGIKTFCEDYALNLRQENVIRELLKTKRIDFTTNHISNNVFKFSQQAAISKIKTWQETGLIEKIGDIQVKTGNRPSNHYGVTNILVAKYIFSELSVREFLDKKVANCSTCKTLLLRDWDLKNQHRCHVCQEVTRKSASTT